MTKSKSAFDINTKSEAMQLTHIRDELSKDILEAFKKADRHMQIHANMFGDGQASEIYMRNRLIMGELMQSVMGIVGWPGARRDIAGAGFETAGGQR